VLKAGEQRSAIFRPLQRSPRHKDFFIFLSIPGVTLRPRAMRLFSTCLGWAAAGVISALALAGCANERTTSYHRADFTARKALKAHYNGGEELSDADVVGSAVKKAPSDEDIRKALDHARAVDLKLGETVLVLQSGQSVPDGRMIEELNKHYRAVPFSGIRSDWTSHWENTEDYYPKSLRYAAAKAGAQKILCFWGALEVARHDLSTKTITWLPVVDIFVPDQKDNVRVHLKVALVDVRTGDWTVFRTEPLQSEVVSTGWGREHLDTPEVRQLKEKSYLVAVNTLLTGKQ
jgi:hypothetical protein